MTEAELRETVSVWQHRLGLEHWRIVVKIGGEHLDEDAFAMIERHHRYDDAVLTVQPWALGQGEPPDTLEAVLLTDDLVERKVVHELLHLWSRDMAAVVDEDLVGLLQRDVYLQITNAFRRGEERMVDGLAAALVKRWPTW